MTNDERSIDIEIEVPGSVEEVWRAIATGPGISSWYVPHTVEERTGGVGTASFGDGPEMQVTGRIAAWEPPRRIVMDGGDPSEGLVFEWLVEARDGGSCVVRLINSGFGKGGEWDSQFDAMYEGWSIFLSNLRLHLEYHSGETAETRLPMAYVGAPGEQAWPAMVEAFGIPADADLGDRVTTSGDGVPHLSGVVTEIINPTGTDRHGKYLLRVDEPVLGTAFIGAESHGPMTGLSAWTYLYGPDAEAISDATAAGFTALLGGLAAQFTADD